MTSPLWEIQVEIQVERPEYAHRYGDWVSAVDKGCRISGERGDS